MYYISDRRNDDGERIALMNIYPVRGDLTFFICIQQGEASISLHNNKQTFLSVKLSKINPIVFYLQFTKNDNFCFSNFLYFGYGLTIQM